MSLARLNDGAPVLVNHDPSDHVGVVERAWIGDDRKGRAVVRFGKGARADEIFTDVVEGIRRHVSVGATITGSVERDDKKSDRNRDVYRIKGWEPREISFASVPADPNVGVGRTATPKTPKVLKMEDQHTQPSDSQLAIERQRAAASTAERINEIYAIGQEFGCSDLAREFATTGKTSDDDILALKRQALDKHFERKQAELEDIEQGKQQPLTQIGMSSNEVQRYSITRALNAILEGSWKGAEFEKECSQEISRTLDRQPNGIFVPHEVQNRQYSQESMDIRREMTTGGTGTGAEYVGTRISPENFIEQLRNAVVVTRAGARMLPGMRQNLDIPKKTSGATFAWVAEGGTTTLSDLGTDNLVLSPKTVTGGTQASRRMLKQSIPAIDDLIMQDLVQGAAEAIDLGALQGSGASNQPTGVFNTSGVPTSTITSAGDPTLAETVEFETDVAAGNALRGSLGWITTAGVVGNMKLRTLDSGSGRFLIDPVTNSGLLGYPYFVTNALTANRVLFGNWQEVLIAMWGVLDLMPDPYGAADSGALIIRAFQDIDVGVRHAESFCVSA